MWFAENGGDKIGTIGLPQLRIHRQTFSFSFTGQALHLRRPVQHGSQGNGEGSHLCYPGGGRRGNGPSHLRADQSCGYSAAKSITLS